MTRSVTILLSSFDGEEWLPDLFASIFSQTFVDWTIRVRDDGSSDGTVDLLRRMAADEPRIELLEDDLGNLGPSSSFMQLLSTITADDDLFAFCDQDDTWLADKLAASIDALGTEPIAAVYTDAEVTDAHGTITSYSALADRGTTHDVPFGQLLINNAAIGATMIGTAALAERAVELAAGEPVLMHDWWVALVAGHDGELTCLPTPTVRWRRHPSTVTGGRPETIRGRAARRRAYLRWSIDAARRLDRGTGSANTGSSNTGSSAAGRAVAALAAVDPDHPTVRSLLRAWRRGGVRAWPLRGQLSLLFSLRLGQTDQ